MKWSFVIQQKLKVALLLSGIMLVIVLGTVISENNIRGLNKSFSSIYNDRLIPATTIIYLTENLYGKRLILESCLLANDVKNCEQISAKLRIHDHNIDSLINAFGKTYLVNEEVESLSAFKNRVKEYALLEKNNFETVCSR